MLRPDIAVPNTLEIATLRNDDAAYGRSLTYSASANDPRPRPPGEVVPVKLLASVEREPGTDLDAPRHHQQGAAVRRRPMRHGVVEIALDRSRDHDWVAGTEVDVVFGRELREEVETQS